MLGGCSTARCRSGCPRSSILLYHTQTHTLHYHTTQFQCPTRNEFPRRLARDRRVVYKLKMQDNVRVGRESLTKKISFHEKQRKPYRTIDSLEKAPTRKKINMLDYPLKKESHSFLATNSQQRPERKIKSLTKNELRKPSEPKKRSMMASEPELITLESFLNRNHKYSLSREREQQHKQKYKRSEQVRSVMDQKKMSSISKLQRKDTEPNPKLSHIYSSISAEHRQAPKNQGHFKDLNLEPLINTADGEEHEVTLQDVFEAGCLAYYNYISSKEQKMARTDHLKTFDLKAIKEDLSALLQRALKRFTIILREAGEMSIKNIVMLGLVKYEQNKSDEAIMYLSKALDKTNHNLMLVELPGPGLAPNQTLTMLSTDSPKQSTPRCQQLNLAAYLALADSFKNTQNYLCSINTLLKWQGLFPKTVLKSRAITFKASYQSLQPREEDGESRQRMKKKSYVVGQLQSDITTNKFKKYSQAYHHHPSIDFSKSKKNMGLGSDRVQLDESQINFRTLETQKESQSVLENAHIESREYVKENNEIYLLLARLYVIIKDYERAMKYYKISLEWNPRRIEAILELASLLHHQQGAAKCLHWLETALSLFLQLNPDDKLELDICYIKYHKSLVLLQEGELEQSYRLLQELSVKELWSEVNYYKGYIKAKQLQSGQDSREKVSSLQTILMFFKQSIASFTSRQYLVKSYFQILLILVFEKKDYYGAQYEVNRFRKLIPSKQDSGRGDEEASISRMSKLFSDEDGEEDKRAKSLSLNEAYFSLLVDVIEGVICILKMKISKGLSTLKELSLKLQSQSDEITRFYGCYHRQMIKLILQFKFYCYYIQRQYELSLKHINKLMALQQEETGVGDAQGCLTSDLQLLGINRLMLECMILMGQGKFNFAMSKLTEIEDQINHPQRPMSGALILNNYYMVKSLCYINLYTQLQNQKSPNETPENNEESSENNKEILLSAEQLLRHCLISDKENSLIYYLISAIHYQLEEYESSLKYIREALEFSDDHMIKHYFCKANTKAMLGRYDEAVKDYTNAVIVFKEQLKSDSPSQQAHKPVKAVQMEDTDDYYQEKQVMYNEIYLNRAIAYLKEAYSLSKGKKYTDNINVILSYRMKATEDLLQYFQAVQINKIDTHSEPTLRDHLLLFLHTDDPSHIFEISKRFEPRVKLLRQEDSIKGYYLIKQLNNCIFNLKKHVNNLELKHREQEEMKHKKESFPPKYKKISMALPKKHEPIDPEKIIKLHFDLTCLQALKRSSSKSQEALEESLINLLELTEQIYRSRESEVQESQRREGSHTLEQMFVDNCGQIFRWSDILFFIGVMHFQLKQYETAIKYFQESYNEKRMNNSLYSLEKYLYPVLNKSRVVDPDELEEEELFSDLEPLFENRIYCKEELEYNLGICYLMQKQYKQAYFYLQNYPRFMSIIRKEIAIDNFILNENQFLNQSSEKPKHPRPNNEILIDQSLDSSVQFSERNYKLNQESRGNLQKRSMKRLNTKGHLQGEEAQGSSGEEAQVPSGEEAQVPSGEEGDLAQNITPFPTRNRLCSIYSPKKIDDKQIYLSFCLPKVELPLLGIFHKEEIDSASIYSKEKDKEDSFSSQTSAFKEDGEEQLNSNQMDKRTLSSVIGHITLLDLEMKPIAPWIKQNTSGVIFTENIVNESVELNSSRTEKKKEKKNGKGKNERYADSNLGEQ